MKLLNIDEIKAGDTIEYIGNNWIAFGGTYKTYTLESSYTNKEDCPIEQRDDLIIYVESGDYFLFYPIKHLKADEWRKIVK